MEITMEFAMTDV